MIDIKLIREQPDVVRAAMLKKHVNTALLDDLMVVDGERRTVRQDAETLQAEQNRQNAEMPKLAPEERAERKDFLKDLSEQIKSKRGRLSKLDADYLRLMRQIPNIPAPEVPNGASDKDNVVTRTEGERPTFDFQPKDHEQLAVGLDLLDMERAAKVSGAKFYYLKNELVILEQSVLRWALDVLRGKGFDIMTVPHLAREEAMYGAGYFSAPDDPTEGDAYGVDRDDLFMIGTAEVGLVNYRAGETLQEGELPLFYAGISPCYRREAGTYGKETRGLYRVHQFNKVEMVAITRPEDSEKTHELLLDIAEELMQKLGLHYQVVLNCAGDLGIPHYKKWDIEAWLPGMDKFGETHSCSNITDYQARSLNIRYRKSGADKEVEFVHTLNNTALASPRILIAILENYQQSDGSVKIPEILVPYTGFSVIERH